MTVIKDGNIVTSPVPVMDLVDWLENPDEKTGIRLLPDQSPELVEPYLTQLPVIALSFPVFSDGRGFSQARQLREQFGYKGELRAVGHLIRDQYLFLHRCGFDSVEVHDESAISGWQDAMSEISVFYQNTVDQRQTIAHLRHLS